MKVSLEDSQDLRNIALIEGQQKLQNFKQTATDHTEAYNIIIQTVDELNAEIQSSHKSYTESAQKEKEKLAKIQKDIATSKETIEQVPKILVKTNDFLFFS